MVSNKNIVESLIEVAKLRSLAAGGQYSLNGIGDNPKFIEVLCLKMVFGGLDNNQAKDREHDGRGNPE